MKTKILSFLVLIFATQLFAIKPSEELDKATKIAWQQRSLLQSIMTSYMKTGAGYGTDEDLKILDFSIAQFEENLDELMFLPKTRSQTVDMKKVQDSWYKFRLLAISEPTMVDAPIILYRGEFLEQLGNAIYKNYRKNESIDASLKELQHFSGLLINSQRMAVYYYASLWNFGNKIEQEGFKVDLEKKFLEAKKEFESIMHDDSWNSKNNSHLNDINSILKSYYELPEGKLYAIKDSRSALSSFDVLVNKYFRLCKKVSNELLKKSLKK